MNKTYGLDVKYLAAWRGKEIAYDEINGDKAFSFEFLPWYLDEFVLANDGLFCALELDNDSNRFKRLFISFGSCVKGFLWCRSMLFLDGSSLKGRYTGTLLS
ncbi:hypothetical protein ACFX2J_022859 [Malus domestica]